MAVAPTRRWLKRCAWLLAACILVIVGVTGWASYSLYYSELPLTFLRGPIEAAARSRMPADADVQLGSVRASYSAEEGLQVRLADLSISLPGRADIRVGSVSAAADSAALLSRTVNVRAVRLSDIEVNLPPNRAITGSVLTPDSIRSAAEQIAEDVLGADENLRAAGLASLEASRVAISWGTDPGSRLRIANASWVPLNDSRSKAWLQMGSETKPGWDLTFERETREGGETVFSYLAEDVPASTLAPVLADPKRRPNYDGLLGARGRLAVGSEGRFITLEGILSSGNGYFSMGGDDRVQVAAASLTFDLEREGDRIAIRAGEIRTLAGGVAFDGWAERASAEDPVRIVTRLRGGALPTGKPEEPLAMLRAGGMVAHVDLTQARVDIERLEVATEHGNASVVGQANFGGTAPGLSLALSVSELPAGEVRALWPPFVAGKTRRWFDENVSSGVLGPASLQVSLPAEFMGPKGRGKVLPSYALVGALPFRDAVFSPFRTFPKIEHASGEIGFADAAAAVTATSGTIDVPEMGTLDASGTVLVIRELGRADIYGDLHLEAAGSAPALAELSNTKPLNVAASRGIVPTDLTGDAELSLDATVPLFDRGEMSSVKPRFRLALTNFSSKSPIEGRTIEDANIVLEGAPESYTVKGRGRLDGIEASVDLIAGSAAEAASDVTLTLDDAAREQLGLSLEGFVSGPVAAKIKQAGEGARQVELDLKDARVMLPFAGWEKGPGVAAKASFEMVEAEDGSVQLRNLDLDGERFRAKGQVFLGPDKRIAEIDLSEVTLRPGDKLSAKLTRRGEGFDLRLEGSQMDARGLIQAAKSGMGDGSGGSGGGDGGDYAAVNIAVKIGSVVGQGGIALEGLSGVIESFGGGIQQASLRGTLQGRSFEWALDRKGDRRSLRVISDAGGLLVRFLGIYDKVAGGNLVLEYSGDAAAKTGVGSLVLADFRVLDEPALTPAVQSARRRPEARSISAEPVNPGDLRFDRLVVPFRRNDGVINIDEAYLRGPVIGATGSGTLNLEGRKVAVSGTFIPIFGLNNIAGSIPILGTILGGGRNEGLLGITYKLFGPLDQPTLTMNPLSAIAPGIFRKLFEYR